MGTWKDRAERHLVEDIIIDPQSETGYVVLRKEIRPSKLAEFLRISPQKASIILESFENYEKETLRYGSCVYKLVQ